MTGEGIETLVQLEQLRTHQCDEGQGYYFVRPEPSEALSRLIDGGRLWRGDIAQAVRVRLGRSPSSLRSIKLRLTQPAGTVRLGAKSAVACADSSGVQPSADCH
jgi:hypothetical protein